ncbi:MAG: hypothetical protein U1E51_19030 [Candidatus Binatia bacterium]|nr:hypothetical protein [Candidatus Binatia bacterium]
MEQYKGYWITGSADPGPPYTTYWEILGTILKPHRGGSVVEVARLRLPALPSKSKNWRNGSGWSLRGSWWMSIRQVFD